MPKPAALLVTTPEEMQDALAIRRRVFVEEQHVPEEIEIDAYDAPPALGATALHVVVRVEGEAVATGRLLLESDDGVPHIGRVAVLAEQRGRGHGRTVMLALHDVARKRGIEAVRLAAQLHAIGFYEKLGYVARGPVFLDAGIEHRWMDVAVARPSPE